MKSTSLGMGYATYPYLPCSSVLSLLSSLVRGFLCTECRSSLGWEDERVTVEHQQRRNRRNRMLLTGTRVVHLPRLDDRAWNELAARGEHTTLEIYVLTFHFRRDRLSDREGLWK